MSKLAAALLLLPLLAAAPASAQSLKLADEPSQNRWKIPVEAEPQVGTRGLSLPVISYTAPDGSLRINRGIVAGFDIARNTTLGVGIFETLPKRAKSVESVDEPLERKARRSRKAAVGLSFSF